MKEFISCVVFWSFIIIKGWGTLFAAWSWWWFLFPIIPELVVSLQKGGLL